MTAQIDNYETHKADISASVFVFPHNPNTFDADATPFVDRQDLPYTFTHLGWNRRIKTRQTLGLNGHFDGSTRNADYRRLVANFTDHQLKKFYFADDKFYIGRGIQVKKTPSGLRPNHIDYIATFLTPFGILFDNNQKSGNSSSATVNAGNVDTPIEFIEGTVTSGATVTIKDGNNNGIAFTASGSGTATVYLINAVSSNNDQYLLEYWRVEVDGVKQVVELADTSGNEIITLAPGQSLSALFTGGTITNITPTFLFRNGWSSE